MLGIQIAGILIIIGWVTVNCLIMFIGLFKLGILRIDRAEETIGLDLAEHGG